MTTSVLHARFGRSLAGRLRSRGAAGRLLLVACALSCASACAGDDAQSGPIPAPPSPSAAGSEEDHMPAAPRQLVAAAVADAARRASVPPGEVRVVNAERVTWPDGALGCPMPGMIYTQALVPGYRIVLEAGGRRFDYHASMHGAVAEYCPADRVTSPAPPGNDAVT